MRIGGSNPKRPRYLSDFFSELKRRNVFKVAVAYAVVGWLVIAAISMVDFTGEFRFKWYDHVGRSYESK